MSAWIVSRAHIDVLVQGLCESEIVTDVDPDEVGRVLWRENHRSVNYRYDERRRTPAYRYRRPRNKPDLSGLHHAIACYQYQTCERPDWERSTAYRWTQALREALAARDDVETMPPFGTYPWGYEEKDVHGAPAEEQVDA